jgi:type II secretory pathway pseudopilin PulG
MKRDIKQFDKKAAFTIVELLTVMSIIVILIGLLVPALNMAKQYAKKLKQMAMFHSIDAALELFNNEFDGYPPSGALDPPPTELPYCGAMKLCEAMMGQDLLGFHTNSIYRRDGFDGATPGTDLYPPTPTSDNLKARKGPFLPLESANAFLMQDIYGKDDCAPFDPCSFVLCDEYTRNMLSGKKAGMPILYYKANTANSGHYDPANPTTPPPPSSPTADEGNIYNYFDNLGLLQLGKPWVSGSPTLPDKQHSLYDGGSPDRFYELTKSHKITTAVRPYRADSYILLSAGADGEYGTSDDIFNFEWKYRE